MVLDHFECLDITHPAWIPELAAIVVNAKDKGLPQCNEWEGFAGSECSKNPSHSGFHTSCFYTDVLLEGGVITHCDTEITQMSFLLNRCLACRVVNSWVSLSGF